MRIFRRPPPGSRLRSPIVLVGMLAALFVARLPAPSPIAAQSAGSPTATAAIDRDDVLTPGGAGAYAATAEQLLTAEVDRVLQESAGRRASVGALVVSLSRGDTLYSLNADRLLEPASNVKLFTTAAALHYLGPGFSFRTNVLGGGPVDQAGVLHGDLILEGRGDPNLSGRFYGDSVTYALDQLAEELRSRGITRVTGDLVADDSYFDGPALGEGWAWDTQQWWYSAEIDALSFNDNTITIVAEPGPGAGAPARIRTIPETGYVTVQSEVTTVRGRSGSAISVRRAAGSNVVVVTGRVASRGRGAAALVTVHDPAMYALSVFRNRLARAGISVDGAARRVRPDGEGESVSHRTVLATHLSPPLSDIVKVVNKRSQNFYAEQLLKTIGAEVRGHGTAEAGIAAVDEFLGGYVGLEPGEIYMVDGSGLSRLNLVTPNAIVRLLARMRTHRYGREFYDSLVIPGEDESWRLDEPLTRGNVHAKTGTVRYVSAYSGYVTAANKEQLVFSIVLNNRPDGKASSVLLENDVVRALARFTR